MTATDKETGRLVTASSVKGECAFRVAVLAAIYGTAVFFAVVFSPAAGLAPPAATPQQAHPVISDHSPPSRHG